MTAIRVFDGKANPHEPFWYFGNTLEGSEEPVMELYGYISEFSWFEDDITPRLFKDDLWRYGNGGPITIRMNSYGGDVIAASVMSSILREYPGKVTVQIDGIAASAATVVALSGDTIRIQDTAYFMIHDPLAVFFLAALNIEELKRLANSLQSVKEGIVNTYQTKTGLSRDRLSKMMTDETWMDANRALDLGFVDEVISAAQPIPIQIPSNVAVANALRNYANVPPAVMQALNFVNVPETQVSSEPLLTDDMKREAQSLSERVSLILKKEEHHA